MDIARAMALGGEIVYANDCDFSSYLKLGLRCPVCKEPVYLKDGEIRKPHFAHFKGTDHRQVEKCELRAAAYDNNTESISSIEDREQRLEIFQTRFLNMIFIGEDKIVDDSKFHKWINLITLTHNQVINNITKGCTEYFLTHRQLIESKYIVPRTQIKDRQILLQQEIALEAMSYLCVKSSCSLLEYILHYSIYKLHNQPQEYNLLKRINTEKNILGICLFTAKIIILNPWVEAFAKITANDTIINFQKTSRNQTKTSVLCDWSMPVKIQLKKQDFLADILGTKPIWIQLVLENNLNLAVYRITDRYSKTDKEYSQEMTKLFDLATVDITDVAVYQWLATSPSYEDLAVQINKNQKLLPSMYEQYNGLTVTLDNITVGDKILCRCENIGTKLIVKTSLNKVLKKPNNQWLHSLMEIAKTKMLQANGRELGSKIDDYIKSRDKQSQILNDKYKTMLTHCRKLIRIHQPDILNTEIERLAQSILKYCIYTVKLDKHSFVDLYHKLKDNKEAFLSFRTYATVTSNGAV
ncbi:MAG: hypothetical protein KME22_09760 [Hassallia sp. WJT32-NPBG1]|jgi:hypothetical protein|nr:hypothetical protein [Hassallia sp. WJT32-NPBG1]